MKKSGISAIVATVLIILITVAAVTIIWVAIIPLINENLETGESFDTRAEVVVSEGYTNYNAVSGLLEVQIKQVGEASRMELVVSNEGNSKTIELDGVPGDNQKKKYVVELNDYFDSLGDSVIVKAIPYVVEGNSERTGTASAEVEVRSSTVEIEEGDECEQDSDCYDGDVCTLDLCDEGECSNDNLGGEVVGEYCLGPELLMNPFFNESGVWSFPTGAWDNYGVCGMDVSHGLMNCNAANHTFTLPGAPSPTSVCGPAVFEQTLSGLPSGDYLITLDISELNRVGDIEDISIHLGDGGGVMIESLTPSEGVTTFEKSEIIPTRFSFYVNAKADASCFAGIPPEAPISVRLDSVSLREILN